MQRVLKSMKSLSLVILLLTTYFSYSQSDSLTLPYLEVCKGKNTESCTKSRLYLYFSSQLKYPTEAQKNKIEGIARVSFIINQDGKIINPIITKNIGNGCDKEVLRLFEHLKTNKIKWIAGTETGRKVSFLVVDYPIYFDLEPTQHEAPQLKMTLNPQRIIRNISFKRKKKTQKIEVISEKKAIAKEENKPLEEDLRIYDVVDKNPIFPGCRNGGVYNDTLRADDCSAYFLQRYLDLRQYIQYPERAYQNGIEGVVKISYNVEKDGSMSNIYCITDIGGGCGQAVVWAFQRMKASNFKWYPAIYKNRPVRVNQTFELHFNLAIEKARRASAGY